MKLAQLRRPARPVVAGIRSDGFRVGLSLAFHPDVTALMRDHGAVWSAAARMWVVPRAGDMTALLEQLGRVRVDRHAHNPAQAAALLQASLATPEPDAFAPDLDVKIYPVADGGGYVIDGRFDRLLVACLRAMGGRFLRSKQGWHVQRPLDAILAALAADAGIERGHLYLHDGEVMLDASGGGVIVDDRPRIAVDGARVERAANDDDDGADGRLSIALQPLVRLPLDRAGFEAAIEPMALLDHQPAGIWHLLSANSALLADDMGLGKTRQAVVAGHLVEGRGCVLVVCPANLSINWAREIAAVDSTAHVQILGRDGVRSEPEWLVSSYERLGEVVQAINEGRLQPRAVFFDEAHSVLQPSAARTLNAFLVAQKVPRRYPLTATPILNRIVELHTLLRLSGHPLGDMDRIEFAREFSASREARLALAQRVSEWMLRRPKSVLGLEPKVQDPRWLQLSPAQAESYRRIAADGSATALAKIGRLRQQLERFKADWLISTVAALDAGDKTLIMCEFQDTVDYLAEEFAKAGIRAVTYMGKHSPTRKQAAIDAFQTDPQVRLFIGTTKAAGVGHNLTAANFVMFASLPWTAALKRQAEDRAWRHGQTRSVTVLVPLFGGTIDEQAMALIEHKAAIEQDLLQDPVAAVLELDADPIDADAIPANDPEYAAMLAFATRA